MRRQIFLQVDGCLECPKSSAAWLIKCFMDKIQNCSSEFRDYAARRGLAIHDEYIEPGHLLIEESKPQLKRLIPIAQQRRFDVVLVWEYRPSQKITEASGQLLSRLAVLGVTFIILRDNPECLN